jgi:hypothetical protein
MCMLMYVVPYASVSTTVRLFNAYRERMREDRKRFLWLNYNRNRFLCQAPVFLLSREQFTALLTSVLSWAKE